MKPYTVNEIQGYDYTDVPDYWLSLPRKQSKVFLPIDFQAMAWPDEPRKAATFISRVLMEFCALHKVRMFLFVNDDDSASNITLIIAPDTFTDTLLMDELEKYEEQPVGIMRATMCWKRLIWRSSEPSQLFRRGDNLCAGVDEEEE